MNWNKFKNNKTTLIIGHLIILPIIITIIFYIIEFEQNILKDIYITFSSLLLLVFYGSTYIIGASPFCNIKMIYSQYGTYFLVRNGVRDGYISYYIRTNKYWILLSQIEKEKIMYWDSDLDYIRLNKQIEESLKRNFSVEKSKLAMKSNIEEWDGIIDDVTKREKTIDKVIK